MTRNQIAYWELQQTKLRDERNYQISMGTLEESKRHNEVAETETQRHNVTVETETERHNRVVEEQAETNLGIQMYNAESGRIQAQAAQSQAGAAWYNAETNRYNAETNRMRVENDYEIGMQQLGINQQHADAATRQAGAAANNSEANLQNATTNYLNYLLSNEEFLVNKAWTEAKTETERANAVYTWARSEYQRDENFRQWIYVWFGSLKLFREMVGTFLPMFN